MILTPEQIERLLHAGDPDEDGYGGGWGSVELYDGGEWPVKDVAETLALHPRLLDALRSTVRQLEAVPEDVPGWMQRTMLCRRARELAKEAGETWAMGNGETLDSAKPTGALFPVPLNLGDSTIIAPEVWEEHLGEKIPVKKTTGEVVGWAVVERNPWGGFQWQVTFHPKPAPGSGGDDQ